MRYEIDKQMRISFWQQVAEFYAEDKGWDVRFITPYQIRLTGANARVDLYPVGQKVNLVGTLEYTVIEDIEAFINNLSL